MMTLRSRRLLVRRLPGLLAEALAFAALGAPAFPANVGGVHVRGSQGVAAAARPGSRAARSWMSPQAKSGSHVIYWADSIDGNIKILPMQGRNAQPIGQLSGSFQSPNRLFVDAAFSLYVADGGTSEVFVYPPGATSPSLTISDGIAAPTGITVDHAGTVYVANLIYQTITEYRAGQTSPFQTITVPVWPEYLAMDRHDNLYVVYSGGSHGSGVIRFRHGSSSGQDLGLDVAGADAVVVDRAGNLIVGDTATNAIDVFAPGATEPSKSISLGVNSPYNLSLNRKEDALFVAAGANYSYSILEWKYPAGTSVIDKNSLNLGQYAIAASPDAVF